MRKRVVVAVEKGQSCRAVAETFDVSVASVVKWSQRYRATELCPDLPRSVAGVVAGCLAFWLWRERFCGKRSIILILSALFWDAIN
jgi:hypothetical protein